MALKNRGLIENMVYPVGVKLFERKKPYWFDCVVSKVIVWDKCRILMQKMLYYLIN